MKLILLRHALQEAGVVEMKGSPGISLKGKKQQQSTDQYLLETGLRVGCVYTSPLQRAVETAQMVRACFSCPVVIEDALGNNFREERLMGILHDSPYETICFVGHAPSLPEFARMLVDAIEIPDIGRSSALVLDVQKIDGRLDCRPLLYITPDGVVNRFDQ